MATLQSLGTVRLRLRLGGDDYQETLHAVQGDTGRVLEFDVLDSSGMVVTDLTGVTPVLFVRRPDGKEVGLATGDIVDGVIRITIPSSLLEYAGETKAQIQLIDSANQHKLSDHLYRLQIEESLEAGASPGENLWFSLAELTEAIAEVHLLVEQYDTDVAAVATMRDDVTSKHREVTTMHTSLQDVFDTEQERRTAESARISAETDRVEAENNRQTTFETNETERQNEFETNEDERENTFEINESVRHQHAEERLGQLEEEYAPKLTEVTAQLAQTEKFNFQSSFVETVKGLLFFKAMYFKKLTNTSLEVILVTGDNRHITHTFTAKADGYLISFNCYTGQWQQVPSITNYKWSDISANTSGSWIAGDPAVVYTTTVGSTISVTFEASENATFIANLFKDDRGGLLKFTLDDDETVTISGYSPTIQNVPQEVFSDISEGTHTVKVEFLGADPDNAPRGGTARGWLADTRHTLFTVDSMSFTNTNELEIFAIGSNREFAFRFAPETTTTTEWVPYHSTISAVNVEPPRVRLNGVSSPLTAFIDGKLEKTEDFALLQHIYARHPESGENNLLDIRTVQSVNRQGGIFKVSGALETLENVNMDDSYVMMGAVNNALFDRLLTGIGNTIPAVKADNTITFLEEEEDKVKEYAFVSSENDYVVAYNNVDLRRNMALGTPQYKRISNFLQHRNESILKHYVNIFDKVLIPKGFKYSWGGEYAVGEIEGIRSMLEHT